MAKATEVNVADIIVCGGCWCKVTEIFPETPDCCGSKHEWVLCCYQLDTASSKDVVGDAMDYKQNRIFATTRAVCWVFLN